MLTCGIFYCRDSAEIEVCGSLQTLLRFESDMLRNRQLTIPPTVSGKRTQPRSNRLNLKKYKLQALKQHFRKPHRRLH